MSKSTYEGLDEALVPLHQYLQLLMPEDFSRTDDGQATGMLLDELEIAMPVEIDILTEVDEVLSIGMSPPLYYVSTGYEPIEHRVRITIVEESKLLPRE